MGVAAPTRIARYAAFYLVLTLIGIVFVAPYVLAFFGALKPPADLAGTSPWTPPHALYLGNFATVVESQRDERGEFHVLSPCRHHSSALPCLRK